MEWHGWDLTYMITTTDYGHMKAKWLNNGKHGQGTHCTKMDLIVWPKIPQMAQNLSAQAQKFWISMKKASLGIRSPWLPLSSKISCCVHQSVTQFIFLINNFVYPLILSRNNSLNLNNFHCFQQKSLYGFKIYNTVQCVNEYRCLPWITKSTQVWLILTSCSISSQYNIGTKTHSELIHGFSVKMSLAK